jgi:uncharacterized DUF497 family protein
VAKAHFEWDPTKDIVNQQKHGVGFTEAQFAFADPQRVIAADASHSEKEPRFFCFGQVGNGILTVRFTHRAGVIRILGQAIGERAKKSMSAKIKYANEPIGTPQVVRDFLPPPGDLVFREDGVKITLALTKRSVDFFKREAKKHNTQYQRMIRRLLDAYAEHHAKRQQTRSTRARRAG